MLFDILQKILQEIKNGTTVPNHPFKLGCLSSIEKDNPRQRMVVIRKLEDSQLIIYTDKRSPKVTQFINNPKASLLFYDPIKMTQIILKGSITIKEYKDLKIWNSIPKYAHKDYTTLFAPGTPIKNQESEYNAKAPNFCYLLFKFHHIDYLTIDKPYNIRVSYDLDSLNNWQGSYIVP